jgi:hypothetical protein
MIKKSIKWCNLVENHLGIKFEKPNHGNQIKSHVSQTSNKYTFDSLMLTFSSNLQPHVKGLTLQLAA